jgi:hypothetical protein
MPVSTVQPIYLKKFRTPALTSCPTRDTRYTDADRLE